MAYVRDGRVSRSTRDVGGRVEERGSAAWRVSARGYKFPSPPVGVAEHGGGFDDDYGSSTMSNNRGKRRGRCYKGSARGHFRQDCPKPKKAETTEQALLVDTGDDFDGPGLL
ncbi:hypothetical protein D1007_10453 [Hordeum vulgare]|nr:hypothetical protein D1007_10453 [Hordeum vulgare]